ncbi:MAG: hypothetical protein GC136_05410 [Alphaproteobacteria bacterium]|nr:hypothetical protein [Alphaproteobacteria bacterium]
MPRYNFALPLPPRENNAIVNYCKLYFKDIAEGHLALGVPPHSIPHITVAQFECTEDFLHGKASNPLAHAPIHINSKALYIHGGGDRHAGYEWHGLEIEKTPEILQLHNFFIETTGLTPLTGHGDNYFPHITLARTRENTCLDLPAITLEPFSAQAALFHCDTNGQCLARIT